LEKDLHPLFFSLFFLRDAFLIVHLITYRKFLKSATVNSNFYGKLMTLLQFVILTATIFGINHMQYITLLFPYLSVRYWLSIRQNIRELS
jgi:phosphatidylglycerophosphate synthase